MLLLLCFFILSQTTSLSYCRLKAKTSCVGSLKSFIRIDNTLQSNPFYDDGADFSLGSGNFFLVGFADLDRDGDQDMLLGKSTLLGVQYHKNIATRADGLPSWSKITSGGPFAQLLSATGHWAPDYASQAVFYDMDNDGGKFTQMFQYYIKLTKG